jgi:hypothetical protein
VAIVATADLDDIATALDERALRAGVAGVPCNRDEQQNEGRSNPDGEMDRAYGLL